jgi:hypothetical protein
MLYYFSDAGVQGFEFIRNVRTYRPKPPYRSLQRHSYLVSHRSESFLLSKSSRSDPDFGNNEDKGAIEDMLAGNSQTIRA